MSFSARRDDWFVLRLLRAATKLSPSIKPQGLQASSNGHFRNAESAHNILYVMLTLRPDRLYLLGQRVVFGERSSGRLEHRMQVIPELPLSLEQCGPRSVRVVPIQQLVTLMRNSMARAQRYTTTARACSPPSQSGSWFRSVPKASRLDRLFPFVLLNPVRSRLHALANPVWAFRDSSRKRELPVFVCEDSLAWDRLSAQMTAHLATPPRPGAPRSRATEATSPKNVALWTDETAPAIRFAHYARRAPASATGAPGSGISPPIPLDQTARPRRHNSNPQNQEQPLERDGVLVRASQFFGREGLDLHPLQKKP